MNEALFVALLTGISLVIGGGGVTGATNTRTGIPQPGWNGGIGEDGFLIGAVTLVSVEFFRLPMERIAK